MIRSRHFLRPLAALALAGGLALAGLAHAQQPEPPYGVINQLKATRGHGAELALILLDASRNLPGCLSYVVAQDAGDPDTVWVTEIWTSKAAHNASLNLPQVRAAVTRGRSLIAGFASHAETRPVLR